MIRKITIRSFKSLEDVTVSLGHVNVFIGANGSGKSNLLEAIGVLSAAAEGRVTDQTLLQRGVRPGVPALYKSSFPGRRKPSHLYIEASGNATKYAVTLNNPLSDPLPAWCYKAELWQRGSKKLVGRSPATREKLNPEQGLAALEVVNHDENEEAVQFLRRVQNYVIYSPTTAVLRGTMPENQPRKPLGLSGGQLPSAVRQLLRQRKNDDRVRRVCTDIHSLIDWTKSYGAAPASSLPLSPSAAASSLVIRFTDKYMAPSRNKLSGYDASEGALFVLFLAVLAAHPAAPLFCAVDNADHGLNPRLARALFAKLSDWYLSSENDQQILLTTHNPLVLDGLPLADDRVRLFTVSRTRLGRTAIRRVELDKKMQDMAKEGWTLSRLWVMGHLGGVPDV